jgi:tetratricopeptide (TPR) repeat protein
MDTLTMDGVLEQTDDTLPANSTDHPLYQEVETSVNQGDWQAARAPLEKLLGLYPDDAYLQEIAASVRTRSALLESAPEARPARRSTLPRALRFIVPVLVVLLIIGLAVLTFLALQIWILPRATAQRQTARISEIRQDAQAALGSGDYDRAIVAYTGILEVHPNDLSAQDGLAQASQLRATASLYSEAIAQMEAHRWEDALSLLQQIQKEQPDYRDVAERIAFVQEQQDLSVRFREAEAAFERGYFELAIEKYEALQVIDNNFQRETVQDRLFFSYLQSGLAKEAAAGGDIEELEAALVELEKALAIRPEDSQAKGESQLLRLFLSGMSELEAGSWSQAVTDLSAVYDARPDFAAGVAAQQLYLAKVSWGEELLEDGQAELAVVKYQEARVIKGVDTTGIDQDIAAAEALLATPTPSPEPTKQGSTAASGGANPAPAPTPTPTPIPLPYTLVGMSVKSNCDGYGYIHGIVWSAYDLPISGVTIRAFNTTTGFGPLDSIPTNEDGIYQIRLEKDQIEGLWVVQVLENGQPASQTWGQHLGGGCVNGAQELKADWKRALETG